MIQAGLELTVKPRLALNLWQSSCLILGRVGITDVCHHTLHMLIFSLAFLPLSLVSLFPEPLLIPTNLLLVSTTCLLFCPLNYLYLRFLIKETPCDLTRINSLLERPRIN